MADETLPIEPGIETGVDLHPARAAVEGRGPHGEPLTDEQIADIANSKDVAALSYLWLLSVVIYYHHRASPFISYHAKQGMWLFAFSIPIFLVPGIGHFLSFFTLAGMIIGFLNAAHGHYHDVPIIGKLARGQLTLGDIGKRALRHGVKAAAVLERGVMPRGEGKEGKESIEGKEGEKGSGKKPSWLPFGKIPFLKRRESPEDALPRTELRSGARVRISAEPPKEADRGKAMLSLSKMPVDDNSVSAPAARAILPVRPELSSEGGSQSNGPLSALPVADESKGRFFIENEPPSPPKERGKTD